MAGETVPADDLPGADVPAGDLPQAGSPLGRQAFRAGRALLMGGPMGVIAEGVKQASEGQETIADWAGGHVTDLTGSPAAGAATKTLAATAGPGMVGGVAGRLAQGPLRSGAEWLMQSALKPTTKALANQGATGVSADRAIKTMLDEGISVSRGGIEKLRGKIDALSWSITDALKNSGATIDRNAVASRLQDYIKHIEATDLAPQSRVAAVEKLYDDILADTSKGRHLPVEQMQQIKQAIYTRLKDAYGELGSDVVQGQKHLARGAKEEISAAVPEVAQLNAKEGELLNALQLAQHRAFVTGNKDIGGLAWLTANPFAFAAFMADRSPLFKSLVARMMNQGSQNAAGAGATVGAAAGAIGESKRATTTAQG